MSKDLLKQKLNELKLLPPSETTFWYDIDKKEFNLKGNGYQIEKNMYGFMITSVDIKFKVMLGYNGKMDLFIPLIHQIGDLIYVNDKLEFDNIRYPSYNFAVKEIEKYVVYYRSGATLAEIEDMITVLLKFNGEYKE